MGNCGLFVQQKRAAYNRIWKLDNLISRIMCIVFLLVVDPNPTHHKYEFAHFFKIRYLI